MTAWSAALTFLALTGAQSAYWNAVAMFILDFTAAMGNVEFGIYLARNVADDMITKVTGIGQMLAIGAYALGVCSAAVLFSISRFTVPSTFSLASRWCWLLLPCSTLAFPDR
jgi:hypothetical protein